MILVECFVDKVLVKTIFKQFPLIIKHHRQHGGRGNILNFLNDPQNQHHIGMVDQDNEVILARLLKKFTLKHEFTEIKLYFHAENRNALIVLCDDFEDWLLKACQVSKIDPKIFHLSKDKDLLHEMSTERNSHRIIPLLQELLQTHSPFLKNLVLIFEEAFKLIQ
jgi:hypothetical protein